MRRLAVRHLTVYRYSRPVTFGEHRMMMRPRDSHDQRLVSAALEISPLATLRWHHDVFGNTVARASFQGAAEELRFDSRLVVEHYGLTAEHLEPTPFPPAYSDELRIDFATCDEPARPDPRSEIQSWAEDRVAALGAGVDCPALLTRVTQDIHSGFVYEQRQAGGVQDPAETLARGTGTCRDLAFFMMEALRRLGFAARFVSGYLFDPSSDNGGTALRGGGATHAWVQVFLPDQGWTEFDPTNGLLGGDNLIRVAVTRDPGQALPLQGSYFGAPEDFLEMTVDITVSAEETL